MVATDFVLQIRDFVSQRQSYMVYHEYNMKRCDTPTR
jgi:hypothetical protein